MNNDEGSTDKMKSESDFTSSEPTGDSPKKNLRDWNQLYAEMNVADMRYICLNLILI